MSRGSIETLPSAHPLGEFLPGVYLEDPLARGFTEGLDPALAPVFLTLDCLEAYLDPLLTPPDFLPWLASWMGIELDETLPEPRRRHLVAEAGWLHRWHGTRAGLARLLELVTGGEVELRDSGGTRWSAAPGAEPPGEPVLQLDIVVRVPDPAAVDRARLDRVVREARPAHLPYLLQVLPAR